MFDISRIEGFLLDLDGTLISAGQPLPGALELLERLNGNFALVSNDAEHTPRQLSRILAGVGLIVRPEQIFLAGTCALQSIARDNAPGRLMILGSMALEHHATDIGLNVVQDDPDIVLVARDRNFTYPRLATAANAVRNGATFVVANPDLVHPGPEGTIVPETGALLAAILACTGPMPHRIIGKPEPELFQSALAFLGIPANQAVMVGDNLATDGSGAVRMGMNYLSARQGLGDILKIIVDWRGPSTGCVSQRL